MHMHIRNSEYRKNILYECIYGTVKIAMVLCLRHSRIYFPYAHARQ